MTTEEPVWLPGFFTGRQHAVLDLTTGLTFHGMRVVWSVCGRAAVLDTDPGDAGPCEDCATLAWPPPGSDLRNNHTCSLDFDTLMPAYGRRTSMGDRE